jgi:hypothetical protein
MNTLIRSQVGGGRHRGSSKGTPLTCPFGKNRSKSVEIGLKVSLFFHTTNIEYTIPLAAFLVGSLSLRHSMYFFNNTPLSRSESHVDHFGTVTLPVRCKLAPG